MHPSSRAPAATPLSQPPAWRAATGSTIATTALRHGAPLLARRRTDLVPPLFMRRDEPLLASILAQQAGRLDTPLETAVQLLEWLALAGLHEHPGLLRRPRCVAP